jgi:beta-glucosidase
MSPVGRQMQNRKFGFYLLCTVIAALGTIIATSVAAAHAYSGLAIDSTAKTARFIVKNTGKRTGTEIAQVYGRLPKGSDESFKRLVGWKRITLAPGESQAVTVTIDDQVLKIFDEEKNAWNLPPGEYQVLAGSSSDNTPLTASLVVR